MGDNGETLVNGMIKGTEKLNLAMNEMLAFSKTLNSPTGTFGQLANDPDLAQHLCRVVKNVDELTRQLKPILDDARVFSDKIARHPEVLGVRAQSSVVRESSRDQGPGSMGSAPPGCTG